MKKPKFEAKEWDDLTKKEKIIGVTILVALAYVLIASIFNPHKPSSTQSSESKPVATEQKRKEEPKPEATVVATGKGTTVRFVSFFIPSGDRKLAESVMRAKAKDFDNKNVTIWASTDKTHAENIKENGWIPRPTTFAILSYNENGQGGKMVWPPAVSKLPSSTPQNLKLLAANFDFNDDLEEEVKRSLTKYLSNDGGEGGDTSNATIDLYARKDGNQVQVARYVTDSVSHPTKSILKLDLMKDGAVVKTIEDWQP